MCINLCTTQDTKHELPQGYYNGTRQKFQQRICYVHWRLLLQTYSSMKQDALGSNTRATPPPAPPTHRPTLPISPPTCIGCNKSEGVMYCVAYNFSYGKGAVRLCAVSLQRVSDSRLHVVHGLLHCCTQAGVGSTLFVQILCGWGRGRGTGRAVNV